MAADGAHNQKLPAVRSLHCNVNSFVAFVSRTHRKLDVFWIDYKGKHVKYATLRNFGDTFPINTFVSHPWTFKDAESGDQLIYSGSKEVYYPTPLQGDEDINIVVIGIPVYTLKTRCLQAVRKIFCESQIPHLEIPRTLQEDLVNRKTPSSIIWDEYEVIGT